MSELQTAIDFAREADTLALLVAFLFALWRGYLRWGSDCDRREAALLAQIAKMEEEAKGDAEDNRAERAKNEQLFAEYRQRFWEDHGRRGP